MYFQIKEFEDLRDNVYTYAERIWDKEKKEWITKEPIFTMMPQDYYEAKWNTFLNPFLESENFVYESVLNRIASENSFKYGKDRIIYIRFDNPKDIFSYLKQYKGPKPDRIHIFVHGSRDGIGQNEPPITSITIEDLIKKDYSPRDFFHITPKDMIIEACSTNEGYTTNRQGFILGPTFAEYLTWLFQAERTFAKNEASFQQFYHGVNIGGREGEEKTFRFYPDDVKHIVGSLKILDLDEVNQNIGEKLKVYEKCR